MRKLMYISHSNDSYLLSDTSFLNLSCNNSIQSWIWNEMLLPSYEINNNSVVLYIVCVKLVEIPTHNYFKKETMQWLTK